MSKGLCAIDNLITQLKNTYREVGENLEVDTPVVVERLAQFINSLSERDDFSDEEVLKLLMIKPHIAKLMQICGINDTSFFVDTSNLNNQSIWFPLILNCPHCVQFPSDIDSYFVANSKLATVFLFQYFNSGTTAADRTTVRNLKRIIRYWNDLVQPTDLMVQMYVNAITLDYPQGLVVRHRINKLMQAKFRFQSIVEPDKKCVGVVLDRSNVDARDRENLQQLILLLTAKFRTFVFQLSGSSTEIFAVNGIQAAHRIEMNGAQIDLEPIVRAKPHLLIYAQSCDGFIGLTMRNLRLAAVQISLSAPGTEPIGSLIDYSILGPKVDPEYDELNEIYRYKFLSINQPLAFRGLSGRGSSLSKLGQERSIIFIFCDRYSLDENLLDALQILRFSSAELVIFEFIVFESCPVGRSLIIKKVNEYLSPDTTLFSFGSTLDGLETKIQNCKFAFSWGGFNELWLFELCATNGVPILFLKRPALQGAVGAGVAKHSNLDHLVVEDLDDFIKVSHKIMRDKSFYQLLRRDLEGIGKIGLVDREFLDVVLNIDPSVSNE